MQSKMSSEIQEIFGLCRDDIKRLEKDGVLKPEKNGQGKASWYGEDDLNRLLDIKMYLLSGFRISEMKKIFTPDYDSNEGIDEQIHTYKKRIQMLEFIKTIRSDLSELEKLNHRQLNESGKVSAKKNNMPQYGSKEYYDIYWDFIKLVFIIDFLCQKESFLLEQKVVLARTFSAYQIIVQILKMSELGVDSKNIVEAFLEMANSPMESEQELKEFAKELVEEIIFNKSKIMKEIEDTNINPIVKDLDEQTGIVIRDMMNHWFAFALDYFADEKEIYYVYYNFRKFISELDKDALEKGVVKLGGLR